MVADAEDGGAGEYLLVGGAGTGRLFVRVGTEGWLGNMGSCSGCLKGGGVATLAASGWNSFLRDDKEDVRSLGGKCGGGCCTRGWAATFGCGV